MQLIRTPRRLSLILVILITLLACNLGGGDPTATPPPPPTDVPQQPTATPVPVTEPTEAPEPTQAQVEPTEAQGSGEAAPIEIIAVNGFLDSFESWNVVGLVRNNTERIVDSIEVEIELFDADDNSLYVNTTYVDLFNIAPGEITPFSYTIFEDLPTADNYVATIVGNSTTELERVYPEVRNTQMVHDDGGDTHITGEFVNGTDQPMQINSLAAATFDGSGNLMTANSYSVSIRYLDPGESGPFRITITGPDAGTSALTDFEVYFDAETSPQVGPFGLNISDAYDYTDTFGNLHLVGEVTNQGDLTLNVNMVAGIYAADGTVLDASDISLPVNALPPGESLPYDFDFWGPLNDTEGLLAQADNYTIQVDYYWTWETSTELLVLSTQNDVNNFDDFGGEFNGQVVNDSGGAIDSVTVVIYLRDLASGQVIASGYDFIFDELADGGTADYTVYVDVPDGFDVSTAEYFILVVGERP